MTLFFIILRFVESKNFRNDLGSNLTRLKHQYTDIKFQLLQKQNYDGLEFEDLVRSEHIIFNINIGQEFYTSKKLQNF
jgi:hypothetical protein